MPNFFGISAIAAEYARYLRAMHVNRLAAGKSEAPFLRCVVTAIQWSVEQAGELDAQAIANFGNALKAATEANLFKEDQPTLKAAYAVLFRKIDSSLFDKANAQEIANLGNALKAATDAKLFERDQPTLKAAYAVFFHKIASPQFDYANAQAIANLGNALKAATDAKLFNDGLDAVMTAYTVLFRKIGGPQFYNADAQHIANLGNALKAATDAKLFKNDQPTLKAAYAVLFRKIDSSRFANANSQEIANLGNALKAATDAKLFKNDQPTLKAAYAVLFRKIDSSRFNNANPQHIANFGNALKAATDAKLFEKDQPTLKAAYAVFLHKIDSPQFSNADAQAIANLGNALKAGLDAQIIDKNTPGCSAAYGRLIALANSAAFADANAQELANLFNSLRAAVYADVLSDDHVHILRATVHKTLALFATAISTSANLQELSNVFKSLVFFHRHGLLDTATVVNSITSILDNLNNIMTPQASAPIDHAMVVTSLVEFYIKLAGTQIARRAGKSNTDADPLAIDTFLQTLLPQLLTHIQIFPIADITAEDRGYLRRFGLACHQLYRFLDRSKRRRAHAAWAQPIRTFLCEQLVPRQHALVQQAVPQWITSMQQDRTASVSPINMLELTLCSMYRPDLQITLDFAPLDNAQMHAITRQSHAALDHPLGPLRSQPMLIPVLDLRGRQLGQQSIDSSLFHAMSNHRWPSPVFMKIDHQVKAECLPVFARHDGQLYRFDVFGGSKLKPDLVREDYGMMIGIPFEAAPFFNQEWLTSQEAYVYAQRALLPETPGTADKPFANRGLAGRIALGIVPDAQAKQLALMGGDYGSFQIKDGCGFIKASVAATAGLASRHANAPATTRPAHLPTQALQYYRLSTPGKRPEAAHEAEAIVQELLADAQAKLRKPLHAWTDAEIRQTQLHAALTMGDPPAVMATVVPARGDKLVVPDTQEWRTLAKQGLILGRNPYDSKNLYPVQPADIAYSPTLAGPVSSGDAQRPTVFQYTLSGIARTASNDHVTHAFKGMLMIVPDAQWPVEFAGQDVLVSSKDQKLSSAWHSAENKKHAQAPAQGQGQGQTVCLVLHGHLVHKEDRTRHIIAVPAAIADKLAADYDGDEFNVLPIAGHTQLAAHIERKNRNGMDNPKQAKTFTPNAGEVSRRDRILQLRQPLVAHWSTASDVYHALPKAAQTRVAQGLVQDQVIASALPDVWAETITPLLHDTAESEEARIYSDQEARKVVHREIALGIKVGTDAEKTTVPFDDFLKRGKTFQKALRPYVPATGLPYGKGFKRRMASAAQGDDVQNAMRALLTEKQEEASKLDGIPARAQAAILAWFLG